MTDSESGNQEPVTIGRKEIAMISNLPIGVPEKIALLHLLKKKKETITEVSSHEQKQ